MFRSIAFDMSEDTEESFEIPEDDEYNTQFTFQGILRSEEQNEGIEEQKLDLKESPSVVRPSFSICLLKFESAVAKYLFC